MGLNIGLVHDFDCAWCWIAVHQARRLREEFGAAIEWRSCELYPSGPPAAPSSEGPADGGKPTRLELALAAEDLDPLPARRTRISTHEAHEAAQFAIDAGVGEAFIERVYEARWRHGLDVSSMEVLRLLAAGLVPDADEVLAAVRERRYKQRIASIDEVPDPAPALPTFLIDGQALVEQPYRVLRDAAQRALAQSGHEPDLPFYRSLSFPRPGAARPYVAINMVATIDGKTVSGERGEGVHDLGSKWDHQAMRRIEAAADGVMIGAASLRASEGLWYPKTLRRYVVSRSGSLPTGSRFFTDAPELAYALMPEDAAVPSQPIQVLKIGVGRVDLAAALGVMRRDHGVKTLIVEGGSELNAQLLSLDLVDELFLTVAPKIKLGASLPTYAGGQPLGREQMLRFRLLERHQIEDELFLRYRRVS